MWPVQSQEWEVKFFVPQATNSIWRRETRTMATPMRSLSVGVAKSRIRDNRPLSVKSRVVPNL